MKLYIGIVCSTSFIHVT